MSSFDWRDFRMSTLSLDNAACQNDETLLLELTIDACIFNHSCTVLYSSFTSHTNVNGISHAGLCLPTKAGWNTCCDAITQER